MKKMKKIIKNKIFILVSIIVVILIGIIVFIALGTNSQEKKLKKLLESMGRNFYEQYYYESLSSNDDERKSVLMKYARIGFKIDLANLIRYSGDNSKLDEFVNNKTKETCSEENTKIIIYPKSDYGIKDYDIEVILDCGF